MSAACCLVTDCIGSGGAQEVCGVRDTVGDSAPYTIMASD